MILQLDDSDDTAAFGFKLEKLENMWAAVSKHIALNKPLFYKFDNNSEEEEDVIACTAVIMEKC